MDVCLARCCLQIKSIRSSGFVGPDGRMCGSAWDQVCQMDFFSPSPSSSTSFSSSADKQVVQVPLEE